MMIKENELPDGWIVKPFIECIEKEATANKLKIPKNNFQDNGEYAIIDQGAKYIAGYTDDSTKVYKGDLPVIIFGDHTRFFKFIDFQFALGADGTKILVPKKRLFNPKYLYYFLSGMKIENHGYSRHYKFLKDKQIIVPPLPTQAKIVAILEKAERLREWRNEADELTDEFLKSTFLDMFGDPVENPNGWGVEKLHDVAEIVSGVTKGRKLLDKQTVLIPYMRVANVQDGYIDLSEIKTIEALPSDIDKYALLKGDVLLTEGGDPDKLGRGAVWHNEIPNCIHQNHIFRVRADKNYLLPDFLSMLIASPYGKRYFLKSAKQTTGIASINSTQLKKFPALIPPLELQKKFTDVVQQIKHMREYQNQSRQHIDDLFNVLMQRAFEGELS